MARLAVYTCHILLDLIFVAAYVLFVVRNAVHTSRDGILSFMHNLTVLLARYVYDCLFFFFDLESHLREVDHVIGAFDYQDDEVVVK